MPLPLDDPGDPRLAPFRDLRDRELLHRHDAFMLEGRVVLDAALTHRPDLIRAILLSDRAARSLADDLLPRVPPDVPIYTLPEPLLASLVGFNLHRGVLALAARPALLTPDALLDAHQPRTVLLLDSLINPDNVGACFRNAAALGADALLLTASTCDPLYRKAVRVSAGHVLTLPWTIAPTLTDLLNPLHARDFLSCALACTPDATPLPPHRLHPHRPIALLLGTEGPGLSSEALAAVHQRCTIPMRPGVDSLNVATAGALALWAQQS